MGFDKVVKNGTLYSATDTFESDIGIKDGKIEQLGQDLPEDGAKVIDAEGKQVLPGAMDVHVHFNLPFCGTVSKDDYDTGAKAAARGGLTTLIDYGFQDLDSGSLVDGVQEKIEDEMEGISPIDYSVHGAIMDWNEQVSEELEELVEAGITSNKMFMIYSDEGWQSDDVDLLQHLQRTAELGTTMLVHHETDAIMQELMRQTWEEHGKDIGAYGLVKGKPNIVEYSAIQRTVELAEYTGGRLYIVHMSTGEGADISKRAHEKDLDVFVETCSQYLMFNDSVFKRDDGHLFATAPQIKSEEDRQRLWEGLDDGEVQIVATDTCTFDTEQKSMWEGDWREIPLGMPGVETMFPLMYTHGYRERGWSLNKLVRKVSTNPSKILGMHPDKGSFAIGSDADLIVVDPEHSETVSADTWRTDCDWCPYEGETLYGFPEHTLVRGKNIVEDREVQEDTNGHGQLIDRKPGGRIDS
ncbi:MAG: dihydroorotase family protein [bacterium]